MKIKIFEPKNTEEFTLFLKLEPSIQENMVYLYVTDASGKVLPNGSMLCIYAHAGRPVVERMLDLNKSLGFELDEKRRIVIK